MLVLLVEMAWFEDLRHPICILLVLVACKYVCMQFEQIKKMDKEANIRVAGQEMEVRVELRVGVGLRAGRPFDLR